MRQILFGFLQVLVRSFIMMAIMLFIFLSVITREFPPDFRRIAETYERLQNYQVLISPSVTSPSDNRRSETLPAAEGMANDEESEVQKLADLYEKRALIGRSLLDPRASTKPRAEAFPTMRPYNGEVEILRAQLLTCEDQLKIYEHRESPDEE